MHESVLITGSSGTVGSELSQKLIDRGHDVHCVDKRPNGWLEDVNEVTSLVDLCDTDARSELPSDVDVIVHFAANARVHKLVKNPEGAKENFDMVFNVLEHARENDINKVLFASSREVYGNTGKIIYSEEDTYVDECESPYTASKVGGESLVKAYENCYGIDSCIFRFSNVYGRYDDSDRVIPLFIAQAQRGQDLTVYGSDKVLDFTYIEDCVDGIVRAFDNFDKIKGTTLNIASGEGTSIKELAEIIREEVGTDIDIRVKSNRTGEVGRYVADISKANKILGFEPRYSLERGIEETISWYDENEEILEEVLN